MVTTRGKQKKKSAKKYDSKTQRKVGKVMHEYKQGELKSGRSRQPVKSRKQAVAIALSEARQAGGKVPQKNNKRSKKQSKKKK